jgi:predicted metal-dependent peptidase
MENARRRVTNIKMELNKGAGFFATLISLLKVEPRWDLKFKTMATNGFAIFYDPDFVMNHTKDEMKWVFVHEILHVTLKHSLRKQANPEYWNAAADYALNFLISELDRNFGTPLPDGLGGANDETKTPNGTLVKEIVKGWNAESIYQFLLENNIDLPPEEKWNYGGVEPPPSGGGGKGGGSGDGIDGEPVDIDELIEKAKKSGWGSLPAGFRRAFEKLTKPVIDWKEKLRQFVQSLGKKTTWTLPDKRFLGIPGMDPQYKRQQTKSGFKEAVIICDTSGSIGEKELVAFASETLFICSEFDIEKIYLIWCDADIHYPVEEINPKNDEERKKLQIGRGGGGTSFVPPFEWIEENIPNKSTLGPVIYFTDAFGPFPEKTQFGIPDYEDKIFWVVTYYGGDEGSAPNVPFGTQIKLPINPPEDK